MSPWLRVPFYYGWVVVATAFASILVAAGIRSAPQVFILPLEGDYQVAFLAGGVIALCGALLSSRIRVRPAQPAVREATA